MARIFSYVRFHLFGWVPTQVFTVIKLLLIIGVLVSTVLVVERIALPKSGGTWVQIKSFGSTLNRASYWGYRYYTHTNAETLLEPARRTAGTLDGMTEEGEVLLRVYADGGIYQIQAVLADLEIRNLIEAATTVNQYQRQRVTVDYYQVQRGDAEEGYVVVWLADGRPLNEVLILNGSAKAMPTPPVNIVNRLMFNYYKMELRSFF